MNSSTPDGQHPSAVAFWQEIARAWAKPVSPEEHEEMSNQALNAVQATLDDVRRHGTKKQVRSVLDDLRTNALRTDDDD